VLAAKGVKGNKQGLNKQREADPQESARALVSSLVVIPASESTWRTGGCQDAIDKIGTRQYKKHPLPKWWNW